MIEDSHQVPRAHCMARESWFYSPSPWGDEPGKSLIHFIARDGDGDRDKDGDTETELK